MYDYIIVGAGSAGCVLADRLSHAGAEVLLLEAGGRDWNPFIHMPGGLPKLVDDRALDWRFETEPEAELGGRRLYWPRGRVLGGSSSVNAMIYMRGHPADYDAWAEAGAEGWAWDQVLPYFLRSEDQERGPSELHGVGGPLSVADLRYVNPLTRAFIEAGTQAGHPLNQDFNGPTQRGVGLFQVTQKDARRWSTASAYLRPAMRRSNLSVITGARVHRVEMSGSRATGVSFRQGRRMRSAAARGEVFLSAGSVMSPQLLLLSGIGPARHLAELGIEVRTELSGVGGNLQDHLDVCTLVRSRQPVSLDMGPLQEALVALRYLFTRSGIGCTNAAEAGGFASSSSAQDGRPDIQFHFVPAQLDDHGRNRMPGHGYTLHSCNLRPESRGEIRLASADPEAYPRISPRYLSRGRDLDVLVEGVEMAREIFRQSAFDDYRGEELFPGEAVRSREEVVDFIRRKAETIYHPVGTCRMGSDEDAVVDPSLRVRGVDGLRVVDASVMPTLVSGNTNAPVIMLAERAADMITRGAGTGDDQGGHGR